MKKKKKKPGNSLSEKGNLRFILCYIFVLLLKIVVILTLLSFQQLNVSFRPCPNVAGYF